MQFPLFVYIPAITGNQEKKIKNNRKAFRTEIYAEAHRVLFPFRAPRVRM